MKKNRIRIISLILLFTMVFSLVAVPSVNADEFLLEEEMFFVWYPKHLEYDHLLLVFLNLFNILFILILLFSFCSILPFPFCFEF